MYSIDRPLSSILGKHSSANFSLKFFEGEVLLPKILGQHGPWLYLSLKSQIPKLFRNNSGFPIIIYI